MTPSEIQSLQEALKSDFKMSSIRLREGEHQFGLAKAIASFQLELYFPDVKDIIKRLYGEKKASDVQLVRKVQTILKKMEKSNIVKILPKKRPWELQKYTLSSFKFQDIDKNLTVLATEQQIKQAQDLLDSTLSRLQETSTGRTGNVKARFTALTLALVVAASYAMIVWDLVQPAINPIIIASAFSIAIMGSVVLGIALSKRDFHILRK